MRIVTVVSVSSRSFKYSSKFKLLKNCDENILIFSYFSLGQKVEMPRSTKKRTKHDRGRPQDLPGEKSRDKKQCPVPGCNALKRTDHLRNHWNSLVIYDEQYSIYLGPKFKQVGNLGRNWYNCFPDFQKGRIHSPTSVGRNVKYICL